MNRLFIYFHFSRKLLKRMLSLVVNRIYTGHSSELKHVKLECIYSRLKTAGYNPCLYTARPFMIRLRCEKNTILIFSKGKIRLMGVGFDSVEHAEVICTNLLMVNSVQLQLVSSTVRVRLPITNHINLITFARRYSGLISLIYEPEIFPAVQLTEWNGVNVNLFHTGSLIIMGRNAEILSDYIESWFHSILPLL